MIWRFTDSELQPFEIPAAGLEATALAMARVGDYRGELSESERREMVPMAEVRQFGFASGRYCAKLAQLDVGLQPVPVLRDARVPVWPAGCTGSITHSKQIAAAVVSRTLTGVGVDVEEVHRLDAKLYDMLFTDAERDKLPRYGVDADTVMFSAKEAGYKAIYPLGQKFIGFQDAEVDLDTAHHTFRIRYLGTHPPNKALDHGRGHWVRCAGHVLTLFVIT